MPGKSKKKPIGTVTHYYDKIVVAVVALAKGAKLAVGDTVQFSGKKTNFTQTVSSLQVDHKEVDKVAAGDSFGMKVDQPVEEGDFVFPT